jgi:hypothetical protein
MFKRLRILILLIVLLTVAASALLNRWRAQSWSRPQVLVLYPLNADASPVTERYLEQLDASAFRHLEPFFASEAQRHGLALDRPMQIHLGRRIASLPPPMPRQGGMAAAIAWSLRLRWWAWRNTPATAPMPDVRLYLLYHEARAQPLPHSTGLREGRLGLAQIFASPAQEGSNEVVIAHEALHTFGASDKYDPVTLQPQPPQGYAEPLLFPPLPQRRAELMAGRIPLAADRARIPLGLEEAMLDPLTAQEIGWLPMQGPR